MIGNLEDLFYCSIFCTQLPGMIIFLKNIGYPYSIISNLQRISLDSLIPKTPSLMCYHSDLMGSSYFCSVRLSSHKPLSTFQTWLSPGIAGASLGGPAHLKFRKDIFSYFYSLIFSLIYCGFFFFFASTHGLNICYVLHIVLVRLDKKISCGPCPQSDTKVNILLRIMLSCDN